MAITLENCKLIVDLTYFTDVNSMMKIHIMIHFDKVVLFVGGRLMLVDNIEIANSLGDLLKKINCLQGAIDIVSNRELNLILQDILRTPLYATFPLKMNMYAISYFEKMVERSKALHNDHIAFAVAEYTLHGE